MTGDCALSQDESGKGHSPHFLLYVLLLMWKKRIKICQGGMVKAGKGTNEKDDVTLSLANEECSWYLVVEKIPGKHRNPKLVGL